jgi:hypothetical protein
METRSRADPRSDAAIGRFVFLVGVAATRRRAPSRRPAMLAGATLRTLDDGDRGLGLRRGSSGEFVPTPADRLVENPLGLGVEPHLGGLGGGPLLRGRRRVEVIPGGVAGLGFDQREVVTAALTARDRHRPRLRREQQPPRSPQGCRHSIRGVVAVMDISPPSLILKGASLRPGTKTSTHRCSPPEMIHVSRRDNSVTLRCGNEAVGPVGGVSYIADGLELGTSEPDSFPA